MIVLPQIAVRLDGFDTIIAHFSAFWNSFLKFFLDFQILFYPVISMTAGLTHRGSREALLGKNPSAEAIAQYSNEQHVTAKTPPALLFHSDDDTVVPSMNSVVFYQALKKNKVPAVLYIFDKGGHGWGMRNNFEYHNQWTNLLANWLKKI